MLKETIANKKRLFVLDANVLMHDTQALLRIKEQDVYLPMLLLNKSPATRPGNKADSSILANVLALNNNFPDTSITLSSWECKASNDLLQNKIKRRHNENQ